jgi:hypothetical protein
MGRRVPATSKSAATHCRGVHALDALRLVPLVLVPLLAGCSSDAPADDADAAPWHGRDLSEPGWQRIPMEHASVYEVTYRLNAGQSVAWDWVVPDKGILKFSVHTHDERGADVGFNSTAGSAHKGSLVAPQNGYYGLQWTNTDDEAALYIRVTPGGTPAYYPPPTR